MKRNKIKTLQNKAEQLWKEMCLLKWGKFCHVKKNYPHLNINHTSIIQIDHCISRKNKYFFLDVNNGLPVCKNCNSAKSWGNKSVNRAIDTTVKRRNPKWFADAVWLDQSGEPNVNFSKVWWLEEQILDLENEICENSQLKNN